MDIRNLRKEIKSGVCYVKADVECGFSSEKELWFSVDSKYADWLTCDVYDAFMVGMLFPCMYYGENLAIEGNVSKKLYHNATNYVEAVIKDFLPTVNKIGISVVGYADAAKNEQLHIGTGFSGGVDSFTTLVDWFWGTKDSDYKIDTLFFFHVGQYGNVNKPETWKRAENRFQITKSFADEVGLKAIMLQTNIFSFMKPEWEYLIGVLCRITSVLIFQASLKRYYISNGYTYGEMIDWARHRKELATFSDPYIIPLCTPDGISIDYDGAQYTRTEKTLRISDNKYVQKHLNVCVNSFDDRVEAVNCGICHKCMRTMMTIESMGKTKEFGGIFDFELYRRKSYHYKCAEILASENDALARDNVNFARRMGQKLPTLSGAKRHFVYMNFKAVAYKCLHKIGLRK